MTGPLKPRPYLGKLKDFFHSTPALCSLAGNKIRGETYLSSSIESLNAPGRYILFLSIITLVLGSAAILIFNEMGEGIFLIAIAFLVLVIFYYRISGIKGSGYEKYRESLDICVLFGFDLIAIIQFLIHPGGFTLIVAVFLICITNLALVARIYKKHFPKVTRIPGHSQLE